MWCQCSIHWTKKFDEVWAKYLVYPPVIKHGNGKSAMNGGFDRNITYIFQRSIFHCHVWLPEGILFYPFLVCWESMHAAAAARLWSTAQLNPMIQASHFTDDKWWACQPPMNETQTVVYLRGTISVAAPIPIVWRSHHDESTRVYWSGGDISMKR